MSDLEYSDEEYYDDEDEEMLDAGDDGESRGLLVSRARRADSRRARAPDSASEMDMEAFDTFKPSIKGKEKSYDVPHTSLSQPEVEKEMAAEVEHISGIFGVDVRAPSHSGPAAWLTLCAQASTASLLLRHMNWNKEKLIEKYMDNADAVTVAAGVALPAPKSPEPAGRTPSSVRRSSRRTTEPKPASRKTSPRIDTAPAPFVCPICFDDGQTDTLALACGHAFCVGCWAAYATSRVRAEGEHTVRCMAEGCALVAPDAFVARALADDPATVERHRELLVRHFVGARRHLKFCPYPSCTHTVSCPAAASRASLATVVPTVTCGASRAHQFCFGCEVEGDHRPCVCAVARMWLKKCADDSETANWIKSNTKECSKCQSTIEKNGGCK